MLNPVEPLNLVELLPPLSAELIALLRSVRRPQWLEQTICTGWAVRDVTAHLLDTALRDLSIKRDRMAPRLPDAPITNAAELAAHVNRLNAEWVVAARRISPNLLVDMLELVEKQMYTFYKSLPPEGVAVLSLPWSGAKSIPVWLDVARIYVERWTHQQHIRMALGAPLLVERRWLFPVFDTLVRALPDIYQIVREPQNTTLTLRITGEAGGEWSLVKRASGWRLYSGAADAPQALLEIEQDMAWRLMTRAVSPQTCRACAVIHGDQSLGLQLLMMCATLYG